MPTQQNPRLNGVYPTPALGSATPSNNPRNPNNAAEVGRSVFGGVTSSINRATSGLRGATKALAGGPTTPTPPLPPTTGYVPPVGSFNPTAQPSHNGYNPTTAPHGMDMTAPGVKEQHWNMNQNKWFDTPGVDWANSQLPQYEDPWFGEQTNQQLAGTIAQPGAGQQYWNGISGQANTMTAPEATIAGGYSGPNNAQTAFDTMTGRLPGSLQPQFDAYYDRMKQKNMGDVNAQAAARGSYGSSSALNGAIGASLDAEAQRAKAATDFSLADSANQRQWMDSYSGAGRAADLSGTDAFRSNIDAAKFGLDKTKTFGDLAFAAEQMEYDKNKTAGEMAFGVDEHKRGRLQDGISTALKGDEIMGERLEGSSREAGEAQDAREDRINRHLGNIGDFDEDITNFLQTNGDALIGEDGELNDAAIESYIAKTVDERNMSEQDAEVFARDLKAAAEAYAASKGVPKAG